MPSFAPRLDATRPAPRRRGATAGFLTRPLLVALVLGTMALVTVFGDRGLIRLVGLARDLAALTAATDHLADENRRLSAEIAALRSDPRALEAAARRDLGLVAPDELIFEFSE